MTIQTLKLSDDLMDLAADGTKCITIRKGFRPIALGPMLLEPASGRAGSVGVEVWSVFAMSFVDIPLAYIIADGAPDHSTMFEAMRRFYPDFQMHDECTVVCWRSP